MHRIGSDTYVEDPLHFSLGVGESHLHTEQLIPLFGRIWNWVVPVSFYSLGRLLICGNLWNQMTLFGLVL